MTSFQVGELCQRQDDNFSCMTPSLCYGEAVALDIIWFLCRNLDLAWSTKSGSESMLYLIAKLVVVLS